MKGFLTALLAMAAGCASTSSGPSFVIAKGSAASSSRLPGEVARSEGGLAVLLEGEEAPQAWEIVSALDGASRAKLYDLGPLLEAVEAGQALPVYVTVELGGMSSEAVSAALAEAGFEAQTISGDVATGRLEPSRIGPLTALPFVKSVSASGTVRPRS